MVNSQTSLEIKKMKRPLELWQGIIATCLLLLTVGTIIVNQSNTIATQQEKITSLIESKNDTKVQFKEVNENLKGMTAKLTDILVELQNKQDRAR